MKVAKRSTVRDSGVAEVDDVIQVDGPAADDTTEEMVNFALTKNLKPPPRIGTIDLTHLLGVSELKKGVIKLPRNCAEVLADKGYGALL